MNFDYLSIFRPGFLNRGVEKRWVETIAGNSIDVLIVSSAYRPMKGMSEVEMTTTEWILFTLAPEPKHFAHRLYPCTRALIKANACNLSGNSNFGCDVSCTTRITV